MAFDPDNQDAAAFMAAADPALGDSTSAPSALAPTPGQPTSIPSGRCQVKRFLGEGGKKKVYLAQDTPLLGRPIPP